MQVGQRRYAKSYRSRRCQEFGLRASTTHVTALDIYLGIRLVEEFYLTDFYRVLDRPLTRPPLISDRPAMPKSDSQSPHYLSAARACPCVAFPLIVNQRYPSCRYLTYSSPTFAQIIRIISAFTDCFQQCNLPNPTAFKQRLEVRRADALDVRCCQIFLLPPFLRVLAVRVFPEPHRPKFRPSFLVIRRSNPCLIPLPASLVARMGAHHRLFPRLSGRFEISRIRIHRSFCRPPLPSASATAPARSASSSSRPSAPSRHSPRSPTLPPPVACPKTTSASSP